MANAAIATVVSVVGKAYARNADGELRELRTGDVLVEGETVVNPDGGRVELSMTDGSPLVINDMPEMTLTRDLMAETAAGPDESAVQDETVDQVLAALESGEDLGDVLEATAAGASGGEGGEGNSFIRLGRIAEDTTEFSGLLGSEGMTSAVAEDENYLGVDANDDSAETGEGEPVVIDVKDNDIFPDGGSVTAVTQGGNGKVVINADNTVTYTPDEGFYGEDEFTYTVVSADGGGTDAATVRVNVTGEPAQLPTISIGDAVVVEGDTATITISLSQVSTEDVTVSFSTADGSATIVGKDYNANGGTVTIKAGDLSTTVSVSTNPDNVEEGSENLLVNLSNPINATIADGEGEIIITDDYVPPTISINDVTVTEGDVATLTVSLSRAVGEDVTFKFDSADGSATVSGGDYNPATGVVTIPAGTTAVTISAQTNADNLDEASERFTVDLSEVTNATVADGTGVVTIIDNFTPPATPPPPPVVDPNLPPVAVDDTASTEANTPVVINVLPNDSDPDGDTLSITGFTQPANGSVVQNPDGTFTYTPDGEFSGNDSFTYTITDGEFSSTADVNIFVDDNPVEIADENPLARGIQRVLDEALLPGGTQENPDALKGVGSFDVTSKDGLSSLTVNGEELIDDDGTLLQGTIVTDSGDHVQVTFTSMDGPTADGVYTINYEVTLIKPFANDPGSDSVDVDFVIAALDTDGDPAGPVTRSATIQDDNPIANDDTNGIVPEDEGLITGDVFLGDASGGVADLPGADGASITSISFVGEDLIEEEKAVTEAGTTIAGDYGDLTIKSDGTYDYQLNQAGQEAIIALDGEEPIEEQFTYVLTDGDGDSDPATLTITLTGRNDPPDAVNDEATTNEDTPVDITVLTNDSDPDGDPLDVTVATDPANGSVVINEDNTLTYTPDENFNGEDTFEYTISDGKGGTDTATVSITVNPAVDFPTTDDKSVSGNEDNDIPITLSGDDSDGTVVKFTINTLPTDGVLKLGGVAVTAGQVIDANGDEEASLTFTPNANWNGDTSFTYASQDNDANNDATPATVSITVNPAVDFPTTDDKSVSGNEDNDIPITLSGDDSDGTVVKFTINTLPTDGVLKLGGVAVTAGQVIDANGDEEASLTFTPNANWNGDTSFTYASQDNDANNDATPATVSITVNPAVDFPTTDDKSVSGNEDNDIPITLSGDDSDGTVVKFTINTLPTDGVLKLGGVAVTAGQVIDANGDEEASLTFTPNANWNGDTSFTYASQDNDANNDATPATVSITVNPAVDFPTTDDKSVSGNEDNDIPITLSGDDSDGTVVKFTINTLPTDGVLKLGGVAVTAGQVIDANGDEEASLTFTPNANWNGDTSFTYASQDNDANNDATPATVSITVNPAVDFPTTDDKSVSGNEDNDIPITLSGDDSDGTVVKFTINTLPTDGVLKLGGVAVTAGQVIDANGDEEASLTFTPNENWNGDTSFTYASQDNDANNDATPATVSITVNPVNDPPVANDDSGSVNKGQTVNIDLATNDTDIDGTVNPATIVITSNPSNGSVTVNADGTVDYQHDDSLTSGDSFKYTILDNDGLISNEATVTVTVSNQAPEIDMSLSGMDVDEGHLVIGNDYVDPQTSDPKTTDTGSIGFKTGDQPFTLSIGSATFTSLAAITAANGTTVDTEHGTLTFGALTGPVDGTYTLAYSYQLDEAEDHSSGDADPGQDRILVTLVDNDGDNVGDQYITVGIVDDKPVGFDPDSAFVVDGSGVASGVPLNFSNSVGADDPGSVVFSPIAGDNTAKDINGNILKIEGKPLFFYTSDDALELKVATANPYDGSFVDGSDLVALTFEIDGDTYTLTSNNGVISNGTDLSNADLSGVRGGNADQLLLINAFESSSNSLLDVLASGVGNSADNTVNSNDFSMGVGAGNDVDFKDTGDVLKLEFVSGLSATGNPATPYDSRVGVNNFKLPLLNVRNDATLTVTLYNAENLVGTLEYDTTTDGLVIPEGVDSRIDNYFSISTEENFTTVVIEATAGNFKVGQFALTEFVEGQPVNISVGVTGMDSDDIDQAGDDSVTGTIDVTVQAANDNLIDASSDPLTGTSEDDIFIWELADATSENDVVVGFGAEGNDILDLRDILQLEDSGAPGEIGNLEHYLSVSLEGSDTVIGVSSAGAFTGVPEDINFIDQTITLQNVDMVTGNGDLEGIIQNMLDSGKLLTD